VTCTHAGPLAAGATSIITIVVAVGAGVAPTVINVADVSSATTDLDPTNNSSSDPTTIIADVDLSIDKQLVVPPVSGGDATWTLIVRNLGESDAVGPITVTDVLPAGLTFVSGTGDGWTCSAVGQVVTCVHDGPLAAGASSTITLVTLVTAAPGTAITNSASVSSGSIEVVIDNNSASATISSVASPASSGSIALTGTDARRTALFGGLLTGFGLALSGLGGVVRRRRGRPRRAPSLARA
jgi:uncharacterized repeat protein (TIGR01451 family)